MKIKCSPGFTLVELIMVIVIIGLLAVAALPSFYEMRTQTRLAAMHGIEAGVQAGVQTWHYNKLVDNSDTYPNNLDTNPNGSCNFANPCFSNVLDSGLRNNLWIKDGDDPMAVPAGSKIMYNFNANGNGVFHEGGIDWGCVYTKTDGSFLCSQML